MANGATRAKVSSKGALFVVCDVWGRVRYNCVRMSQYVCSCRRGSALRETTGWLRAE